MTVKKCRRGKKLSLHPDGYKKPAEIITTSTGNKNDGAFTRRRCIICYANVWKIDLLYIRITMFAQFFAKQAISRADSIESK